MAVIIRRFQKGDGSQVKQVALESWKYTYDGIFSMEEIVSFNDGVYAVASLERLIELYEPDINDFFVAVDGTTVIGFAQISFEQFWEYYNEVSPAKIKQRDLRLGRIYLLPDYIGKGIGRMLLDEVEKFVRKHSKSMYHVLVHKDNKIGIKFYEKNGFERSEQNDMPEDGEIAYIKKV